MARLPSTPLVYAKSQGWVHCSKEVCHALLNNGGNVAASLSLGRSQSSPGRQLNPEPGRHAPATLLKS